MICSGTSCKEYELEDDSSRVPNLSNRVSRNILSNSGEVSVGLGVMRRSIYVWYESGLLMTRGLYLVGKLAVIKASDE